jgi:2'-5' RNA ligase
MMRLFFALPLPAAVRGSLAALRPDLGRVRWVPEPQLHLTLRFLGEVDDAKVAPLLDAVRAQRAASPWPAITVSLRGLGIFGRLERPRVLWAAVEPVDGVAAIARSLDAAAVAVGLPGEERAFAAHVTLARFRRAEPAALAAFLRAQTDFATAPFDAREVVLMRSTMGSGGVTHDTLHRIPIAEDG